MFTLITGGSGSGKSAFAENWIIKCTKPPYVYAATMLPFGEESKAKIARHQQMRRGKGFKTVECPLDLGGYDFGSEASVLLECMSNLTANEMYRKQRSVSAEEKIIKEVKQVRNSVKHLSVVTNEVFSDGLVYQAETRQYLQTLGLINQRLAEMADIVIEVVYGNIICFKGQELYCRIKREDAL